MYAAHGKSRDVGAKPPIVDDRHGIATMKKNAAGMRTDRDEDEWRPSPGEATQQASHMAYRTMLREEGAFRMWQIDVDIGRADADAESHEHTPHAISLFFSIFRYIFAV